MAARKVGRPKTADTSVGAADLVWGLRRAKARAALPALLMFDNTTDDLERAGFTQMYAGLCGLFLEQMQLGNEEGADGLLERNPLDLDHAR